jgi:hypothetical protein
VRKSREWLNGAILDTSHKMTFYDTNTVREQELLSMLAHRVVSLLCNKSAAIGY